MTGRRLDWDKAKWDSFRSRTGPATTSNEINTNEEFKLQDWWDAKKDALLSKNQRKKKRKKATLTTNIELSKVTKKKQSKKKRNTHAERLAKWKKNRKT